MDKYFDYDPKLKRLAVKRDKARAEGNAKEVEKLNKKIDKRITKAQNSFKRSRASA
ncbi:MAG: hypothetical protein KGI38_12635 [Thaumarchaeota archaeon]|nr:hypothetical protein [Nitrososphaerota archaeon]